MAPTETGTPNTASVTSSRPRWLRCWQPLRYARVVARRGPNVWARVSAGIRSRVTCPQQEPVRAWRWNSVITADRRGSSATWCQDGSGSSGPGRADNEAWQRSQWVGTRGMVCWTRSGGKRRRDRPRWPGCPPVCLPVRFLTTGLGAWGGLDDGGREELEAFCPRRAWRSRTVCSNWAMRSSSSAQREQFGTGSLIAPLYQHEAGPIPLAANRLSGYRGRSHRAPPRRRPPFHEH